MDDFESLMATIGQNNDQAKQPQNSAPSRSLEENSPKRPVATSVLSAKTKNGKETTTGKDAAKSKMFSM